MSKKYKLKMSEKIVETQEKKDQDVPKGIIETGEIQTISAKYEYTDAEKVEIAEKLAQRQIELVEAEDEKKTAMATFTDRIKRIKLDISKLSRGYRDGWEFRDHEVCVIRDYDKKEIRFKDKNSGKIVHTTPFGPGDEQRRFA